MIALENSGFRGACSDKCHERTVPSRDAETIKVLVGEQTARTYTCQLTERHVGEARRKNALRESSKACTATTPFTNSVGRKLTIAAVCCIKRPAALC